MSMVKRIFLSILAVMLIIVIGIIGYVGKIYFDVKATANESYEAIERINGSKNDSLDYESGEPFSVLLLGTDSGDLGRTEQGRSDTMIVATVNPKKETTTLVSIPRDTYTEIVGHGTTDKINHAYAYGGVPMSLSTVENLLNIPIDYYVQIDLKGMKELVDAVGGVDVNNAFSFNYEGTDFPIGKLHLDGAKALKYSRMRYDDPDGDYGRQKRQRQIVTGILDQLKSVNILTNYKDLLEIIGGNMKTDVPWNMMQSMITQYRPALKKIKTDQLMGTGFTGDGATGEQGISYQKVEEKELVRVQNELKEQLK
ncbi:LCP family protein [Enterococcus mundtii]